MHHDICAWPKCHDLPWKARGLPICREHAEFIGYMFTDTESIKKAKARIFELECDLMRFQAAEAHPRPEPRPQRTTPTDGVVYYVQIGAHIKIGWTSNMTSRMRTYPPNSRLLATHPGTRKDEHRMHRRFAADRTHGREWYVPSVSLTHHIGTVIAEHGTPDSVDFGAKPLTVKRTPTSSPIGAQSTKLGGRAV